ncbi:MAG: hypothetical protein LUD68_01090 [Rikenellaceae bacterium]|nr:hypothetical protein [Rikenellaceae bacterium]
MKKNLRILFSTGCALLMLGCDELMVKDISNKQLALISPTPQAVLSDGRITFSWEEAEFVDYYRLTLAASSSGSLEGALVDSLLEGTRFTLTETLAAGAYEWRLQGYNAEYRTPVRTSTFRVQTSRDISGQSVSVLSPVEGVAVYSQPVTFAGESLSGALLYRIWVASPAFDGAQQILAEETLEETLYRMELPDGAYQWRIQACNEDYQSEWQTIGFRVRSSPDLSTAGVTVLSPKEGARVESREVLFAWEALSGAEDYRITLAKPDFDRPEQWLDDTVLSETTYRMELQDGEYQWRIQGRNTSSQTSVTTLSFRVETVPDISGSSIRVITPVDHARLGQSETVFSWDPVPHAANYRIRVVSPSFDQAQWLAADWKLEETVYRLELPDGEYEWQLQALNAVSQTAFRTGRFQVAVNPDLSGQQVRILSPSQGVTLREAETVFAWEPMDGAENYRLTVVSPSFEHVEKLVQDLTLIENSFRTTLTGGAYQWRIIAQNGGSRSEPLIRSFSVAAWEDISDRQITVIAPAAGIQTANRNILFAWEPVKGAARYRLMIASPSFDRLELLIEDAALEETSLRVSLDPGRYQWRIQALNDDYQTTAQTYGLTILE